MGPAVSLSGCCGRSSSPAAQAVLDDCTHNGLGCLSPYPPISCSVFPEGAKGSTEHRRHSPHHLTGPARVRSILTWKFWPGRTKPYRVQ